jgi:Fur family ferric uptake transcriptional regulator
MYQLICLCVLKVAKMNATEILQHHEVKKTAPRVAIIQALQKGRSPLSESELKDDLGDFYDRTTFYRSMQTLAEAGVIHRIVVDNLLVKYVLNDCEHGHHHQPDHVHFYCQQCKALICMDELKTPRYELPSGFKQQTCEVIIRGLCVKCNQ